MEQLSRRDQFVMAAMQALIQVKAEMLEHPTYQLSSNREDCCGEIAQAAIVVADHTLDLLDRNLKISPLHRRPEKV